MSGIDLVLDTNILIYRSKGLIDLRTVCSPYQNLYLSVITEMELLGFPFPTPSEQLFMTQIVGSFPVIHTNQDIVNLVIQYRKIKKIKLPDAIILATSSYLNADLLTANIRDFQGIDPNVTLLEP
jgi:predicted nucleic acid-binding protein